MLIAAFGSIKNMLGYNYLYLQLGELKPDLDVCTLKIKQNMFAFQEEQTENGGNFQREGSKQTGISQ